MKKILVVYYSRDGTTKYIGNDIAKLLKCETEEIIDRKKRRGFWRYLMAGRDALKKKRTELEPMKKDPSKYDLVIIGTPTWAGTMVPATRTFMQDNKLKKAAYFATSGSPKDQDIFSKMQEEGPKPIATLHLQQKVVKEGKYLDKVKEFVGKLK